MDASAYCVNRGMFRTQQRRYPATCIIPGNNVALDFHTAHNPYGVPVGNSVVLYGRGVWVSAEGWIPYWPRDYAERRYISRKPVV